MFFYILFSLIILAIVVAVKIGLLYQSIRRLDKIIETMHIHRDMLGKIIEMDSDPLVTKEDYYELLPICRVVDKKIQAVQLMPEFQKWPLLRGLNLSDIALESIVLGRIED